MPTYGFDLDLIRLGGRTSMLHSRIEDTEIESLSVNNY